MKKILWSVLTAGVFLGSGVYAADDDYTFDIDSLIGFEGGYTTFDVEKSGDLSGNGIKKYDVGEAGLKIGAQSHNYRIFLSIRSYFPSGYDYFMTYGGEFQYLFNFSKTANFFIGVNGGYLDGRFTPSDETNSRTLADPYFGGDAGFNFHFGKRYDLEVGARVMTSSAENTQVINGREVTYTFDNLVTGYASLIIKFKMD